MKLKIENEKLYCKPKWSPMWFKSSVLIEDICHYSNISFDVEFYVSRPVALLLLVGIILIAVIIYTIGFLLGIFSLFFDSSLIKEVLKDSKQLFIDDLPEAFKEIIMEGKQEIYLFDFSIERKEVYKVFPELEL